MSHDWKVGDKFIRVHSNPSCGSRHRQAGHQGIVTKLDTLADGRFLGVIDEAGHFHHHGFIRPLYDRKPEHPARPVRSTDPDTSKAAAKPKRTPLRERVLTAIYSDQQGATGSEIADEIGVRLNSVTPRFAELRRLGKIEDSGLRRGGQIVWVAA